MRVWQIVKNMFQFLPSMAISDATSISTPYFQKTFTLRDWWLTKPEPLDADVTTKTIGVAGFVSSQKNCAERCFSTAPILKVNGMVELETVDSVCITLQGFINKERTLENGFSSEVFKHFVFGFPFYWENFATSIPKGGYADKCESQARENGKESYEGHSDILDSLNGYPQDFDTCSLDMGLPEAEDTRFSNKTSSALNASSNDVPHEHVIESGHEVLFEKSSVRSEFKDDLNLSMGPSSMDVRGMKPNVVKSVMVSSTISRCSAVSSSKRLIRSMSKAGKVTLNDLDNLGGSDILKGDMNALPGKKTVNVRVMGERWETLSTSVDNQDEQIANNLCSNLSAVCGKGSKEENISKLKRKRKQNDPDVKVIKKKLTFEVDISNQGINEVRDMLESQEASVTQRIDSARPGIESQEASVTQRKSKRNLKSGKSAERWRIAISPKSPKTISKAQKGSKDTFKSSTILSPESYSGKKSRSGRVLLPPMDFWRNQKVLYDPNRQLYGVEEPM